MILSRVLPWTKVVFGAALIGFAMQFFIIANNMVLGGIGGLAVIFHTLTGLPTGALMALINLPLFVIAFFQLGWAAIPRALVGVLSISIFVDVFALFAFPIKSDLFIAAICSGVIIGVGAGLIISGGSSGGGIDLISRVIRKRRPDISFGQLILVFDFTIISLGAISFRTFDRAVYAIVTLFIVTRIIDLILIRGKHAKVAYIISEHGSAITARITADMARGVTLLDGKGGYSGRDKSVLLCVIKEKQLIMELKRIVYTIDPDAFIIIHESREVLGRGFESISTT